MGIFDKLFKKNTDESQTEDSSSDTVSKTDDGRFVYFYDSDNNLVKSEVLLGNMGLNIPGINFSCYFCTKTENENFLLAYNDEFYINVDGNRKRVPGELVFINGDKLFYINFIERPNDGKLAESGNFVINDWLRAEKLSGIFYAFSSDGEVLIKKKFNSNLGENGISKDGNYAVVETLNSESNDRDKIFFFDLRSRKLIWEIVRDLGNVKKFDFDKNENVLRIIYDNDRPYHYSFNGEFLDKKKLEEDNITFGNGYQLFDIAKEKMEDLDFSKSDFSDYEEVIMLLTRASDKKTSAYTKARIYRMIGDIYYNYDKKLEALRNFKKALTYDPKVGVKRLYNKLTKELEQ